MGKSGEALRAAKGQRLITFTREQLEEHDRLVINRRADEIRKRLNEELRKNLKSNQDAFDDYCRAEWKKREELFGGTHNENLMLVIQLLLATSSRVLIEHFGFPQIPRRRRIGRNRTADFAELLAAEVSSITTDETKDIRAYCDETYEKYGVKYAFEEEKDDEPQTVGPGKRRKGAKME